MPTQVLFTLLYLLVMVLGVSGNFCILVTVFRWTVSSRLVVFFLFERSVIKIGFKTKIVDIKNYINYMYPLPSEDLSLF